MANRIKVVDMTPNVIQTNALEQHFASNLFNSIKSMAEKNTMSEETLGNAILSTLKDFKKQFILGYMQEQHDKGTNENDLLKLQGEKACLQKIVSYSYKTN